MQRDASVIRFSTALVPEGSADDAWRQMTSPTYETSRRRDDETPLRGAITSLPVGDTLVGRTAFGPQEYARTRRIIAESGLDCLLVQLFQVGGLVLHEGTGVIVGTGDIVVYDLARPFDASTGGGATVSVLLPRELLDTSIRGNLHGTIWRAGTPVAELLSAYLGRVGAVLFEGGVPDDDALSVIRDSTVAILERMLAPSGLGDATRTLRADATLRDRIEAFVDANVENPRLGPALIAERFAVSRSTLYRLFDDGVATRIRDARLDAAHRRLTTDAVARVSDVAREVGMPSARTFHRAFRARFGVSPTTARDEPRRATSRSGARAMHDVFVRVGARYSALAG